MRFPRPRWRWPISGGVARVNGPADRSRATAPEEDLRLLRRTRFRLMGLSGLVTLLVLIVLEGAISVTVSDRIRNAGMEQLNHAAGLHVAPGEEFGYSLTGPKAGVFMIIVDPQGQVVPYTRSMPVLPTGLPDEASLAAVKGAGDVDVREITLADGTPCRLMSFFYPSADFAGYKVQLVQNRSGEVGLLGILGIVLLGGGLLALLASLMAGYLYAGRALVPIRESIIRRQGALQRQREFAANASHELRTPLTVIGASVEDLKRNRRSRVEDVGEALGDIEAEVRHMTALVEDMLLLARTDSGVVEIERVPVDMGDIAADAASSLAVVGEERGVRVVLDPLPAPISGDPLRLRQLVTILVDNAIRHSAAGSTVEVRVRPAVGAVVLQVDDQGHGIRPEDLPRLFERFWRADDAPAGGTGLGLAIAKWIVEQHAGRISAVNRPEGGASFRVWIPNHPVRAEKNAAEAGATGPIGSPAIAPAAPLDQGGPGAWPPSI
jgi:signal transduction histidine kinase